MSTQDPEVSGNAGAVTAVVGPATEQDQARQRAGQRKHGRLAEFAGARHDVLNETVPRAAATATTEFVLTGGQPSAGAR